MWLPPGPNKSALLIPLMSNTGGSSAQSRLAGAAEHTSGPAVGGEGSARAAWAEPGVPGTLFPNTHTALPSRTLPGPRNRPPPCPRPPEARGADLGVSGHLSPLPSGLEVKPKVGLHF